MSGVEHKPFAPKSAAEKKLVDPTHTEPVEIHQAQPKNIHNILVRVEGMLGLRFGCDVDEWGYPQITYATEITDAMEDAYRKKASTVGELHIVVRELMLASATAIVTMPINIPGHRKKAVVGTFDYSSVEQINLSADQMYEAEGQIDVDELVTLALARNQIGIKLDAENPYFKPPNVVADPTRVFGATLGSHLHNKGYVSGGQP